MVLRLSPQQLGQLIPFVPALVSWLRHAEPGKAGDLFLTSLSDMDDIQATLRELLNAVNFNGDLTNIQLRYVCACHEPSTWASAVRLILSDSDPRLVSNETGAAIVASFAKLEDADTNVELLSQTVGAILDQLPRSHYDAFGEFCALLRDTAEDQKQLAMLIGPMILTPRSGLVPTNTTKSAVDLMYKLIMEAESIFGRPGSFISKDAFGIRKQAPTVIPRKMTAQPPAGADSAPAAGSEGGGGANVTPVENTEASSSLVGGASLSLSEGSDEQGRQAKRMQQLRAFYLWRDPSRAERVPLLFENHTFEDIAKALNRKYGMLPPGWKVELVELKAQGSTKLDWFSENEPEKEKKVKGSPKVRRSVAPAAPPPIQVSRPQSLRNYLFAQKKPSDESAASATTVPIVPVAISENTETEDVVEPEVPAKNLTKVDKIVNEICDTEQSYHDSLAELVEAYVKTIRAISSGQKGPDAAEALGLSAAEVEQIFGWRLEDIINVSNSLLSKLEVVTLVRSEPLTPMGRQGLVADAFLEISNEIHVYAPYVSAHKSSLQALEKAIKKVSDRRSTRATGLGTQLLQRNRDKGISEMTFTKLWEVISSASPRLKGQSIASILIKPIQRVPRYKLLLHELIKETKPDHPSYPTLEKANEVIGAAALQINELLRQHEKLGKFFGEDEMLNPKTSTVKTTKGKGGKAGFNIKQGYVDGG